VSKLIYFSLPFYGHVVPSLPLIRAFVRRGEEVIYYSSDTFAKDIEEAGARYRPYRSPSLAGFSPLEGSFREYIHTLAYTARELLDEELEQVRSECPACVVHDCLAGWGKLFAEALSLPAVAVFPLFAGNRSVKLWRFTKRGSLGEFILPLLSALSSMPTFFALRRSFRRDFGVNLSSRIALEPLNVVLTSRFFQPRGETFDERFVFAGPPADDWEEEAESLSREASGERSVYVSMGTVWNRNVDFFRTCFEALASFDGRVVLSTGKGLSPEELGKPPDNFIVRDFIPAREELQIIRSAAAVITHGGFGTLHKCLYFAVPLVTIPQFLEHAGNANRTEELGAAVNMKPEEVTVASLRGALERVLSDKSYKRNSELIRRSFRSAEGLEAASDRIMEYACSRSPKPA
jgi:MGT family glycosyltransferase